MNKESNDIIEHTGPIDVEEIKKLSHEQVRQEELNRKQKQKHEMQVEDIKNHPIQIGRLKKSFKYAFQGLYYCLMTQPNMKIHFIIGTIAGSSLVSIVARE